MLIYVLVGNLRAYFTILTVIDRRRDFEENNDPKMTLRVCSCLLAPVNVADGGVGHLAQRHC